MGSREKSGLGALSDHPKNCMCINHLIYFKQQKTKIIDNFLENHGKTTSLDLAASSANPGGENRESKTDQNVPVRPKMTRSKFSRDDSQPTRSSAESLPSLS